MRTIHLTTTTMYGCLLHTSVSAADPRGQYDGFEGPGNGKHEP